MSGEKRDVNRAWF